MVRKGLQVLKLEAAASETSRLLASTLPMFKVQMMHVPQGTATRRILEDAVQSIYPNLVATIDIIVQVLEHLVALHEVHLVEEMLTALRLLLKIRVECEIIFSLNLQVLVNTEADHLLVLTLYLLPRLSHVLRDSVAI